MKKLTFAATITLVAAMMGCTEKNREVTIMSYNIHNGIGLDNVTDYGRIASMIKEYSPDVVAVQEIDSAAARSNGVYVLGRIAAASGMKDYYAPAIDFQGGKYGIGILCRQEPLNIKRLPLPGREEARALIVAEFPDYVFACTHLSLTEADRNASLEIISDIAGEYDKPFFIAGDFNAEPDSRFIRTITNEFTSLTGVTTPTFPADKPEIVIDYIMSYDQPNLSINVMEAKVIDETVMSDHRPIMARAKF